MRLDLRKHSPKRTKEAARQAVNVAIRKGEMMRQPCEECGQDAQAHHEDYSLPLAVRWLCAHHHSLLHAAEDVV